MAFGLHLFRYADEPVVVMQRSHNPQYGGEARLEVIVRDSATGAALLAELRDLADSLKDALAVVAESDAIATVPRRIGIMMPTAR